MAFSRGRVSQSDFKVDLFNTHPKSDLTKTFQVVVAVFFSVALLAAAAASLSVCGSKSDCAWMISSSLLMRLPHPSNRPLLLRNDVDFLCGRIE